MELKNKNYNIDNISEDEYNIFEDIKSWASWEISEWIDNELSLLKDKRTKYYKNRLNEIFEVMIYYNTLVNFKCYDLKKLKTIY